MRNLKKKTTTNRFIQVQKNKTMANKLHTGEHDGRGWGR
jgi:hypothetical protein